MDIHSSGLQVIKGWTVEFVQAAALSVRCKNKVTTMRSGPRGSQSRDPRRGKLKHPEAQSSWANRHEGITFSILLNARTSLTERDFSSLSPSAGKTIPAGWWLFSPADLQVCIATKTVFHGARQGHSCWGVSFQWKRSSFLSLRGHRGKAWLRSCCQACWYPRDACL